MYLIPKKKHFMRDSRLIKRTFGIFRTGICMNCMSLLGLISAQPMRRAVLFIHLR